MPERFSHNNDKDNNDLARVRVRIGVGNQYQFAPLFKFCEPAYESKRYWKQVYFFSVMF